MDWISVKDELPEDLEPVMLWGLYDNKVPTLGLRISGEWRDGLHEYSHALSDITHWQRLPEPPKD